MIAVLPVAGLHDQHYQFLSGSNLMVGGVVVRLAGERGEYDGKCGRQASFVYEFVYISK